MVSPTSGEIGQIVKHPAQAGPGIKITAQTNAAITTNLLLIVLVSSVPFPKKKVVKKIKATPRCLLRTLTRQVEPKTSLGELHAAYAPLSA
jgi:hypothetical protein